jgi:hypothetical protein
MGRCTFIRRCERYGGMLGSGEGRAVGLGVQYEQQLHASPRKLLLPGAKPYCRGPGADWALRFFSASRRPGPPCSFSPLVMLPSDGRLSQNRHSCDWPENCGFISGPEHAQRRDSTTGTESTTHHCGVIAGSERARSDATGINANNSPEPVTFANRSCGFIAGSEYASDAWQTRQLTSCSCPPLQQRGSAQAGQRHLATGRGVLTRARLVVRAQPRATAPRSRPRALPQPARRRATVRTRACLPLCACALLTALC